MIQQYLNNEREQLYTTSERKLTKHPPQLLCVYNWYTRHTYTIMLLYYSGALNACLMAATQYADKSYQEAMLS